MPESNKPGMGAIERKMGMGKEPDHMTHVHAALEALLHPSVPKEIRDEYAEPLLRMKHFGHPEAGPKKG